MTISSLNKDGHLVCMMVATMAAGVLSNPIRVERNEPDMQALTELAMSFARAIGEHVEFQDQEGSVQ